ncbi:MAG TPA: metallophosphoesterase [Thermoplasmata archaeon]|nr:metallophosphoesterase [Thermoplasmata archaeon]
MDDLPNPPDVLRSSPEDADRLLDRLERKVPVRPALAAIPSLGFTEAIVFGDTHGDWRSTLEIERRFLSDGGGPRCLVGLGDYVDRHPADCGEGSVANALRLLGLVARYPDRVFLLQGNHETTRRIPVIPQTLPEEVDQLWGPQVRRYVRLLALLERGPLAATSSNGVYFAHAGFPRGALAPNWRESFEHLDDERLAELVWAECDASRSRRGVSDAWGARELASFLAQAHLSLFLRGHDPDLTGRPLYGERCLTLHTTRVFERFGGVIVAHVPLDRPLSSVAELRVEHLPTEGQRYPPVD